jgi:hypothetical protein
MDMAIRRDAQLVVGDERRLSPRRRLGKLSGMWATSVSQLRASDEHHAEITAQI